MKLEELEQICNKATKGYWPWEKIQKKEDQDFISAAKTYMPKLIAIAKAVQKLPFGETKALPWCIESFPELNKALLELEGTDAILKCDEGI